MATNKMAIARRLNNKRLENDPAYDPPWFYALTSKIQSSIWLDKKRMLGLPIVNSLSTAGSIICLKDAKPVVAHGIKNKNCVKV